MEVAIKRELCGMVCRWERAMKKLSASSWLGLLGRCARKHLDGLFNLLVGDQAYTGMLGQLFRCEIQAAAGNKRTSRTWLG